MPDAPTPAPPTPDPERQAPADDVRPSAQTDAESPVDPQADDASVSSVVVRPPRRGHPLFLISAGMMLAGGLLIQSTSGPELLGQLLLLSVSLLVYHLLLVGLGIALLRRRVRRASLQLFLLAAVFLVDPTFTYLRLGIYRQDVGAGLLCGIVLLSLGQLSAIYGLLLRFDARALLVPAASYLAVLGTGLAPGLFLATVGSPLPGHLCDIWLASLAAALLGPRILAGRPLKLGRLTVPWGGAILCGIPLLGLALRLGALHWIYDTPFGLALAPPLLLAVAWIALQAGAENWPLAAPMLALAAICAGLRPELPGLPEVQPGTWRLTMAGIALLLAGQALRWRLFWLGIPAAGSLALALLGSSPGQTQQRVTQAAELVRDGVLPQTLAGWGALGVTLAFACLLLGAVLSLRRGSNGDTAPARLDALEV